MLALGVKGYLCNSGSYLCTFQGGYTCASYDLIGGCADEQRGTVREFEHKGINQKRPRKCGSEKKRGHWPPDSGSV